MTEQERIESIKKNGGCHLQNFKDENVTYDMCLAAVQSTGQAIHYVPDKFKTEEIYQEACKHGGTILRLVPKKYIKKAICEWAVENDGLSLEYVPDKFKTVKLCLKAVINDSHAFKFVPVELITPKFVVAAVRSSSFDTVSSIPKAYKKTVFYGELIKEDPDFIWYIPKSAHTATICKSVIKAKGYKTTADAIKEHPELLSHMHTSLYDHDTAFVFVNSDLFKTGISVGSNGLSTNGYIDYNEETFHLGNCDWSYSLKHLLQWSDVVEIAISLNGNLIRCIKEELLSYELCMKALESTGNCFNYIPSKFWDRELCTYAVNQNEYNLDVIPEKYVTQEMCNQAIKRCGYILEHMPDRFKTKEICLTAVSATKYAAKIDYVPVEILDKDICIAWLLNENSWKVNPLDKIPRELWDYDICHAAVKADGNELEKIPSEFITPEICLDAVIEDNRASKFVPLELFTMEMAYAMVANTALCFENIPAKVLNEEICLKAISHGDRYAGTVLGDIPDDIITQRICDAAVQKSVWSLKYVPERFMTEDILIYVAKDAPGRLHDNFPERFRSGASLQKILDAVPSAKEYIDRIINTED